MSWHVGDVWEPKATITNPQSAKPEEPVEPGTITFTFKSPKGKETTGTTTKLATGVYQSKQKLTEPGIWYVSVITTEPFEASQPAAIPVEDKFEAP